jgi:cytidylate kinase
MKAFSVAIDGPSGAGKSTIAKFLAEKLNFLYVDTGAMYRSIGLYAARQGVAANDASAVEALLPQIKLDLAYVDGEQRIFLNGEDVSRAIRTEEASKNASAVSAIPAVRAFLLEFQRSFAKQNCVLMDGRDIGTVVLPDADVKIFLTASAEARAQRRYKEQVERGEDVTLEAVFEAIRKRDEADSSRAAAPLKAADDAVVVDTTYLNLEESIAKILGLVEEKLHG